MHLYLAKNLKFLRNRTRLNQSEIADILHITRSEIGLWENGIREPGIEMIVSWADFFEVTLDQIVREDLSKTMVEN